MAGFILTWERETHKKIVTTVVQGSVTFNGLPERKNFFKSFFNMFITNIMLLETITSFKKLDSKKFTILFNTQFDSEKLCTKKSDCLVGIVLKRKLYNVSHGNVNVFGIFWKGSMAV